MQCYFDRPYIIGPLSCLRGPLHLYFSNIVDIYHTWDQAANIYIYAQFADLGFGLCEFILGGSQRSIQYNNTSCPKSSKDIHYIWCGCGFMMVLPSDVLL